MGYSQGAPDEQFKHRIYVIKQFLIINCGTNRFLDAF